MNVRRHRDDPPPGQLIAHLLNSNRYGVVANFVGAAIYAWLLWPIGSRRALALWLTMMAVISIAHRLVLGHIARRSELAAWWRLAPTLGTVGLLWGLTPIVCNVREFSTPRGSMIVVFGACVAANGVVALAAFPQLFLVFTGPILALTSFTYLTSAPAEIRTPVALGAIVMFVVFIAYNRQAHQHLATALHAQEQLRRQANRHHHDATHDELTGLLNRAGFLEALAGDTPPIIFFDLDGFKQVNDLHGHAAGDRILHVVGQRLAARTRQGDLCARLGGDEFVVALRDRGHDPEPTARRLADIIGEPILLDDATISIATSYGIAEPHDHHDTITAIIHRSDRAMYDMKRHRQLPTDTPLTTTPTTWP